MAEEQDHVAAGSAGLTLCIIGGAARHTPDLIHVLSRKRESINISSLRLVDINARNLDIVRNYSAKLADALEFSISIEAHTDMRAAVLGADAIVIQFRVGGLKARSEDIKLSLRHGLVGEETVGVGGFCLALRTIPELLVLAQCIREFAPQAIVLNLSNPTGLGTELLQNNLHNPVIGICTTPWRLRNALADNLSILEEDIAVDYFGLNHLGWVRKVFSQRTGAMDRDAWLHSGANLLRIKEVPALVFDKQLVESLQMIPSPYLHYFYNRSTVLDALQRMPKNRAEILMAKEPELLSFYQKGEVDLARELSSRETLYSLAIDLLDSMINGNPGRFTLIVRNEAAIPQLPPDCTVEIPCLSDQHGVNPDNMFGNRKDLSPHTIALMMAQKCYERLTIEAGTAGDYKTAVLALLTHPLGPDAESAPTVFEDILRTNYRLLPQFA